MSHFTVMVIGDNPEGQLAPYQENNMGDCPEKYMEFYDVEAEENTKEQWEEGTVTEFHANSSKIEDKQLAAFNNMVIGEEIQFEKTDFGTVEPGRKIRFYSAQDAENMPYFEVVKIITNVDNNDSKDSCIRGTILIKKINPPKDIPFKERYADYDTFMKKYHGYIKKDGKFGYMYNPNSKWDWYQLGGRWTGFFIKKQGASGVQGQPGLMTKQADADRIDQGQKKDIDFEAMFDEAADKASKQWDEISKLFGGTIPQVERTWEEITKDPQYNKETINETRKLWTEAYDKQYAVKEFKALQEKYPRATKENPNELTDIQENFVNGIRWSGGALDAFKCTREQFVGRAMENCVSTYAIIKDGKWFERGTMGMFGISSDEKDPKEWSKELHDFIQNADDNTLFSVYDCHV